MRLSIRNILRPTRSLYDIWFKSYDSNSCFHGFWWPWPWPLADFFKKSFGSIWGYAEYTVKNNLDRCKTVACRRCDRQTNRQTNRQTDKRYWPIYFAKTPFGLSQSNKQTDRQTDRQTHKRYWPIYFAKMPFGLSQSNKRYWPIYFAKTPFGLSQSNKLSKVSLSNVWIDSNFT